MTFTDKKVYQAWWAGSGQQKSEIEFVGYDPDFGNVYVYAIVLDDDGGIMKGETITGDLLDIDELDHNEKGTSDTHHDSLGDPEITGFDQALSFNDAGTGGDAVSGDGVYTALATLNASNLGLSATNTREENHIKLRIYANNTAGGLTEYSEVLISFMHCMNGFAGDAHGGTHVLLGAQGVDVCTVCHIGYEHFYENISGTFADSQLDVHALKANLPDIGPEVQHKGFDAYVWNLTNLTDNINGVSLTYDQTVPGSSNCYNCHISGTTFYDYGESNLNTGATTRNDLSLRPDCSNSDCHANTEMEG
ncbi:MAG: hypothetical protein KAI15_02010, partial [Gammaproteobacteria bacterium]|nr:hypothetical protein [Gammaproteobacteria bacterium]